jgi:hypothetical protein
MNFDEELLEDNEKTLNKSNQTYEPIIEIAKNCYIKDYKEYEEVYNKSIKETDNFWSEIAENNFYWNKKWENVCSYNFVKKTLIKGFQ